MILVFDMDGTLANFYGVSGWLEDLRAENPRPYEIANPLYSMEELNTLLLKLKAKGVRIIVTSWLAKGSSPDFDTKVRAAKKAWLKKYQFPYDEIHLVQYGTTKANCTRHHQDYQILIDDNEKVLQGWHLGTTINAKQQNIMTALAELL